MKSRLELFIALGGIIIAFLAWVHPFHPVGPPPFQLAEAPEGDRAASPQSSPRMNAQRESQAEIPTAPSGIGNQSVTVPSRSYSEPLTGIEFLWVPEGCFEMGCGTWTANCDNDEIPVHTVCVEGFWMGRTEVTQGQWKTIMEAQPPVFLGEKYPVEWVSWYEAQEFLKRLNEHNNGSATFRLPTEAEWEYACRSGGKPEQYAGSSNVSQVAWYRSNSSDALHPVGSKNPNGLGLYDMSGNVAEWCADAYDHDAFRKHPRDNPVYNVGASKIVRGGGFGFSARGVRCGNRYNDFDPGTGYGSVGFRIVRKP